MASSTAKKPFFIWSCILHVSILLVLILELSFSGAGHASSADKNQNKNIIHAVAVSSAVIKQYEQAQAQQENQKKLIQQQAVQKIQELLKKQQLEEQTAAKEAEQKIAQQKLAEQKLADQKLADQKLAEQKLAEQKLAEQKLAQQKLAEQKLLAEKEAAEKLAVQKLADQKLAEQKAAELKQNIQKQLKASMDKQLARESRAVNTENKPSAAKTISPQNNINNNLDPGIMDKYKALIVQAISEQWVVPENLSKNISTVLLIRVAPGGTVLDVQVEKSSGNAVLDNSAMAAVKKASPLPVPTEINSFESFRIIKLTVKPDGSIET